MAALKHIATTTDYLGEIVEPKNLVNKEYVDFEISKLLLRIAALENGNPPITPTVINNGIINPSIQPITEETPKSAIDELQFTGNILWEPEIDDSKFAASTVYTAVISLTAKNGYTLDGVDPDIFTIDIPDSSITYSDTDKTLTIIFPETDAKIEETPWEMYFVYDDASTGLICYPIALENWDGFDGSQLITDDIYYLNDESEVPFELWCNNPKDGAKATFDEETATKVTFDGYSNPPMVPGTLHSWGYDSSKGTYGSVYISGTTAGQPIPMKLLRKGE